ncbi:MAG TPA: hypothetical protein VHO24_07245 [Opitutaceae bacterium]|nr:hypothetical protein [Opitutaceae bacterium]
MQIDSGPALRFVPAMRLLVLFCTFCAAAFGGMPPALEAALRDFRADGPPGWSFVQTSTAGTESLAERFDAAKPEFERWTLLAKNGRAPTADEERDYREKQTRRSRGGTAPRITESLDPATVEVVSETEEQLVCRCRLKKGEAGDKTAEFIRVTLSLHKPTQTIETFELGSMAPFSPTLGIKLAEMKTVMSFSRAEAGRPSLLLRVTTRLRGRAFWFKSLDQDLMVVFSDHAKILSKR